MSHLYTYEMHTLSTLKKLYPEGTHGLTGGDIGELHNYIRQLRREKDQSKEHYNISSFVRRKRAEKGLKPIVPDYPFKNKNESSNKDA